MHHEPKAHEADHSKNPIECTDKDLLDLVGLTATSPLTYDEATMSKLPKGHDYNWGKPPMVRVCQVNHYHI